MFPEWFEEMLIELPDDCKGELLHCIYSQGCRSTVKEIIRILEEEE